MSKFTDVLKGAGGAVASGVGTVAKTAAIGAGAVTVGAPIYVAKKGLNLYNFFSGSVEMFAESVGHSLVHAASSSPLERNVACNQMRMSQQFFGNRRLPFVDHGHGPGGPGMHGPGM